MISAGPQSLSLVCSISGCLAQPNQYSGIPRPFRPTREVRAAVPEEQNRVRPTFPTR